MKRRYVRGSKSLPRVGSDRICTAAFKQDQRCLCDAIPVTLLEQCSPLPARKRCVRTWSGNMVVIYRNLDTKPGHACISLDRSRISSCEGSTGVNSKGGYRTGEVALYD